MKFFLFFIAVLISTCFAITCPSNFTALNENKCVQLFNNFSKHEDAVVTCHNYGGQLVSIHSSVDNYGVFQIASKSSVPVWLGLKCAQNTGASCAWDDQSGNAGTYSNFASGYPLTDIGNCVYMLLTGNLQSRWASQDCETPFNFICEVSPQNPIDSTCSQKLNGYCYFPTLTQTTEASARYACQQDCGDLVSIHSLEENNFIAGLFGSTPPDFVRIGAIMSTGGTFSWTDNSLFDYNNGGLLNQNFGQCVAMALTENLVSVGKWVSGNCDTQLPFVCKRAETTQCGTTTVSPSQCSAPFLYDGSGTFNSPYYPNSYLGENHPCNYILSTPIGTKTQIRFSELNLDSQSTIAIYNHIEDSTPVVTYKGNNSPTDWITSITNTMKVVFRPCITNCDTSGTIYKWNAQFQYTGTPVTSNPLVTATPNPSNPSNCNETMLIAPGQITSPNYPQYYPNYVDCSYRLSTDIGRRIRVDFTTVSTEKCCDIIVVRDGPLITSPELGRLSGQIQDKYFVSTTNSMLITFSTDSSGTDHGFQANFYVN